VPKKKYIVNPVCRSTEQIEFVLNSEQPSSMVQQNRKKGATVSSWAV